MGNKQENNAENKDSLDRKLFLKYTERERVCVKCIYKMITEKLRLKINTTGLSEEQKKSESNISSWILLNLFCVSAHFMF